MSMLSTAYTQEACRESAKEAKLRYVSDSQPGIRRRRHGRGFIYVSPKNEKITDKETLQRIEALAIPPAYSSVWISPWENGHIQATGRDERKRKQYRYHPKWEEVRNTVKFNQMLAFAEALPAIRRKVMKDLELSGLPKERVLATVIELMDSCQIRVGNAQYADDNGTYGLTTLRKKHVNVEGSHITFEFIGKSGKKWKRDITNKRIAHIIRQCEEIPGYELFKYIDEQGERRSISSEDVNNYLQEITGQPFTAKDFRTWSATAQALELLSKLEPAQSERENKRLLNTTIKSIAENLGHTPAICRKCYIHPNVLQHYQEGSLREWYEKHGDISEVDIIKALLSRHS